jgi:hypothetical protein
MTNADWAAADVDLTRPSSARIYDYMLGGSHNFAVDRRVAEGLIQAVPDGVAIVRANRSFLRRVVRFLIDAGVRQFLDLGSGIPTVGNVHEVAQQTAPEARVVYVDVDPVAVIHSNAILADNDQAAAIQADLRDPERIAADPTARSLIDFSQPVGVLALAVLQFVPDEEHPEEIVRKLWEIVSPGSYLAVSHGTAVGETGDQLEGAQQVLSRNTIDLILRGRAGLARIMNGFEIIEPGLVYTTEWRPDSPDDVVSERVRSAGLSAVGVKR